jgi:hypothetical protein
VQAPKKSDVSEKAARLLRSFGDAEPASSASSAPSFPRVEDDSGSGGGDTNSVVADRLRDTLVTCFRAIPPERRETAALVMAGGFGVLTVLVVDRLHTWMSSGAFLGGVALLGTASAYAWWGATEARARLHED